jgi:hypothetical protein
MVPVLQKINSMTTLKKKEEFFLTLKMQCITAAFVVPASVHLHTSAFLLSIMDFSMVTLC